MAAILDVDGIMVKFGGLTAVNDLQFEIEQGELMGLIGPNGSGKTTVLNAISGIYKPISGKLIFNGREINGKRPYEIARMGLGRSFQNNQVFKSMSVLENIMVGYHHCMKSSVFSPIVGLPSADKEEENAQIKSKEILGFVGLAQVQQKMVDSLAYGQQKLVEIARALIAQPKLLLLDEPAAGLNPFEKAELEKLIQKINENGITVLMVEHDMKMVMRLCRHIVVLNFGKKIAEGNPQSVSKNPEVIKAYLGEEDSVVTDQ
jgi:branched-chain amino acid transport system ATP-binding protein